MRYESAFHGQAAAMGSKKWLTINPKLFEMKFSMRKTAEVQFRHRTVCNDIQCKAFNWQLSSRSVGGIQLQQLPSMYACCK